MNADSSREEFKTRNGRIVFEGRGIEPDVEAGEEDLSILEISLMQQGLFFDFATEYEAQNQSFDFAELPEAVFEEFRGYLKEREFIFTTDSEKLLTELREELRDVDAAEEQLIGLRSSIEEEKSALFERETPDIKRMLYLELISRYQGQSGSIKAGLSSDPEVLKALEFINNESELDKLLAGE